MEDQSIVALYMARREEAITRTDEKYRRLAVYLAGNILTVREDVEECVSDAYLTLWNTIPPQQPKRLGASLAKVTRSLAIDRWRRGQTKKRGGGQIVYALEELEYMVSSDGSAEDTVLKHGWQGIDINAAGLEDGGIELYTGQGDQVLALDARNGILLIRVYLEEDGHSGRGVLAICKNTSALRLCGASSLPDTGETVGEICEENGGLLAMTGSTFLDDGTSNGGQISGLAVCNGVEMGSRLGGYGDKRLELRNDNRMYIVDSASAVDSDTRDACEFRPALIVDGENVAGNSTWNSPNPRAVLGQSDRLETMMIVVEGRLLDSLGCGVKVVADKLEQYGCVQAMNLDGGTSAIMYYKGEYVTRCSNTELPNGRNMPTAWVYGENAE